MPGKSKKYGLGAANQPEDLDLPSGNTCAVRRPGPKAMIKMGLLDNFDQLTSLVQSKHFDRVDGKGTEVVADVEAIKKLAQNPQELIKAMEIIDRVVAFVVVEPMVFTPPADPVQRIEGYLYTDDVDEDDKMFIFQYVMGGSSDLESFRNERAALVGLVQHEQGLGAVAE